MAALGYRYYLLMILPFMLAMCLVKNLRQVVTFNHVFKYVKRLHIYTCSIKSTFLYLWTYLVLSLFYRYLSPFSILANIIQSIGLGIIFYYIFAGSGLKPSDSLPWFAPSDRLPLFFGTAIFAIEGISVVSCGLVGGKLRLNFQLHILIASM